MSEKEIKKYLSEIGKRGGSKSSPLQNTARKANLSKGPKARAIKDEFSHLPRLERYKARKAKKKTADSKDNA